MTKFASYKTPAFVGKVESNAISNTSIPRANFRTSVIVFNVDLENIELKNLTHESIKHNSNALMLKFMRR